MSNGRNHQNVQPAIRFKSFTDAWEKRKLSDLTESHNSGVYIPKDQYGEGTNIIGVGDIYDSDVVDGQRYRLAPVKDERFILHTNDLLYGESSLVPEGIARVVSVSEAGAGTAFAWHTRRFKVNQVTLNSRFLGLELDYWLPARSHLMRSSTKTALTGITTQDFFNTQIVFPSKPEQEKIATLINSLDTTIALHQRKVENLQQLKKSLLQQMFVSGKDSVPRIRFAGFTDAWEQRKLGEIMNVTSVKRIHQSDWRTSGVRFLRARDIVSASKGEKPDFPLYIDPETYKAYSKQSGKVSEGDLLVTGVGSVGIPYLIRDSEPIYFKDGNIIWFQNNQLDSKFFYYSFIGQKIQTYIKTTSAGGTVVTYTIDSGKKTPIFYPTRAEQIQIGRLMGNIERAIALHQRKVENLQKLKKSLLRLMFV